MLNVPVNNFSVMLGRSHRFLCITSIFCIFFLFTFFFLGGGGYVLLMDTTRRLEWGSNPRLLDPESEVLTTTPPRPHQVRRTRYDIFINVAKHNLRCAGFHYQQVTTLVAGLGIVAFTEGLHNSSFFSSDASSLIRCFLYLDVQV